MPETASSKKGVLPLADKDNATGNVYLTALRLLQYCGQRDGRRPYAAIVAEEAENGRQAIEKELSAQKALFDYLESIAPGLLAISPAGSENPRPQFLSDMHGDSDGYVLANFIGLLKMAAAEFRRFNNPKKELEWWCDLNLLALAQIFLERTRHRQEPETSVKPEPATATSEVLLPPTSSAAAKRGRKPKTAEGKPSVSPQSLEMPAKKMTRGEMLAKFFLDEYRYNPHSQFSFEEIAAALGGKYRHDIDHQAILAAIAAAKKLMPPHLQIRSRIKFGYEVVDTTQEHGRPLPPATRGQKVLDYLLQHPGETVTYKVLAEAMGGEYRRTVYDEHVINAVVAARKLLRQQDDGNGIRVVNIMGIGYQLLK